MTDQTQGATGADAGATGGSELPSAADILAFDPFGPAENSDSTAGAADAKPADDKGGEPGKTPAPAVQPTLKANEVVPLGADGKPLVDPNAAPVTPATTPQAQPTAQLEQLIRDQTAAITTALQRPAEKPAAATEEAPAKYNLGLPPEVIGLLRSEDEGEFARGMHTVINGISNRIWSDVNAHLDQVIAQRVPAMFTEQTNAQSVQQRVATDFYGKYETLRAPELRPLIQSIGVQVANERAQAGKTNEWSPEIRDAIAEKIFTAIPSLRPPAEQQQQQTPPGGTPPKRPFATGTGSRPDTAPDASAEFRELLG